MVLRVMVLFYFQHVSIFKWDAARKRRLPRNLLPYQRDYLQALGLPEDILVAPATKFQRPYLKTENLVEAEGLS